MSRMSDLYLEIEELIFDAISSGYTYENEIVSYVNDISRLKVDREVVKDILGKNQNYWDECEPSF